MCGGSGGGPNIGGAIGGSAVGSFLGGPVGQVIGGVVGSQGEGITGGIDEILTGGAGRRAADAQSRIAQAQLAEQRATRAAAVAAAEPSAGEMAAMQRSIALNEQDITRRERLIASSDPALIEAGQQALSLLRGTEASTLDPIRRQREKDRAKLTSKLQSQLGSGYANSTAGIQALTAFDEATATALNGAQQQSLSQLLGVAQNTSGNYGLQNNIQNNQTMAQLFGNQSSRRVSAINGTPITGAGAEFVGDLARAQQQTAQTNQLLNLGATGASAYFTGGASLAPTAASALTAPSAGGGGGVGTMRSA